MLRKIDISNTKLSNENCKILINNMPFSIKIINFSYNYKFGPENIKSLCEEVIDDPRF